MKNKGLLSFLLLIILIASSISVSAHSGKTDSKGGHYNHSTGGYHYHHGYPEHYHENDVCPYEEESKEKENSTAKTDKKSVWNVIESIISTILLIIFLGLPLLFTVSTFIIIFIYAIYNHFKNKQDPR